MNFKVPQNVQREDTLVAFLTLRHLIILSIGGSLAYCVYVILARQYFWEVWAFPVGFISLLTLAIAFLKINDIPFLKWILLQIEFSINCQKRSWQKGTAENNGSMLELTTKKATKQEKKDVKKSTKDEATFKNINELTEVLDSHGKVSKGEQK